MNRPIRRDNEMFQNSEVSQCSMIFQLKFVDGHSNLKMHVEREKDTYIGPTMLL